MNTVGQMALRMAEPVITNLVAEMITRENLEKYGDRLFDLIEEYAEDSETAVDDAVILPVISAARVALNIPDND